MDSTDEFHWLLDVIDHLQSPVVFAHNDFNRRNTLICESKDNNNNDLNVYLIDFDWSSYGKRGVDFGQYFNCWGQEATDFGTGPFPSDQQMLPFIDVYIVEMSKLVGDDYPKLAVNSRERLLKEAKLIIDDYFSKVYQLLKIHLDGQWTQITKNDVIIQPINDGFTNSLYVCELLLPELEDKTYRKVIVRYVDYESVEHLYVKEHVLAINLILSQLEIAPKLLCVFKNGTISEYIENRYFNASDYHNKTLVSLLARKLARLHSLCIPVPKDGTSKSRENIFVKWFDTEMRHNISCDGFIGKYLHENSNRYPIFSTLSLAEETDWYLKTVDALNCPIVFSHNDLNRRNILISESNNNNNNNNENFEDIEIYLIDFDWCVYDYRGTDFGQYFSRWAQEETDFGVGVFPTNEQMIPFIDSYIGQMSQLVGDKYQKQAINSREQLIKESKVFTLMAFIKDILYCIWVTNEDNIKQMMDKAEIKFRAFYELKNSIINEYKVY
ncbi:choline/ethanolamine kinase-like [Oppia nitens]|uniref:choline/ethanolamine kinase-like n=1 Tax=Oppia nitens TaxID=1686743 RepID=UPI0023D9E427|nr:choline/ethanolamine kinase-like [Oppia nitens]